MRVKICGIKNEKELETAINAGTDAVGFLVGQRFPSQDFILPETAARLAAMVPPFVTPVLVTHLTDQDEIMEIIDLTMITNLQLHGGSTPDQLPKLREYLGNIGRIILAVHMSEIPGEIPSVTEYDELVNAYLLDTQDPVTGKVGGTGKVHNWDNSAAFVCNAKKPVILAGGLNPENVAQGIQRVHPFAVDANSALRPLGELDPHITESFIRNAHAYPDCSDSNQ